jgi:general secretion pathway protein L
MLSIGLFIKDDELNLVALNQGLRTTLLAGYEILPVPEAKGAERDEAILYHCDRFFKTHSGGKDNLFLALPRDKVLMQPVYLPLAAEEILRAALGYEMDRLTPFSADAVYYDYYILKRFPVKNQVYLMLVAVKKEVVDYYLALLKRIGVRPRGIEITATALFNVYTSEQNGADKLLQMDWLPQISIPDSLRKKMPALLAGKPPARAAQEEQADSPIDVLVAYMNARCEINLVSDGMLFYSRSLPIPASENAAPAAQPATLPLRDLQQEVQRGMLSIPEHKNQDRPIRFFLSGREIADTALEESGDQEPLDVCVMRDFPITAAASVDRQKLPLLAIPLSLALKGLRRAPIDLNLIPAALRPKKKRSKKKIAALLAASFIIVLSLALFVQNIMTTRAQIAALDAELSGLKVQAQAVEAMQKEIDAIEKARNDIQQIKDLASSKLQILEDLTRIIPDDSWLTDFEFNADDKKITLSGYSTSASKLIPILEESKQFTNVKFTSPITKGAGVKENFKIEMTLELAKK